MPFVFSRSTWPRRSVEDEIQSPLHLSSHSQLVQGFITRQPRGKGAIRTDPPALPQAVHPQPTSAPGNPSSNSQAPCTGHQELWWKSNLLRSESFHFSKKERKLYDPFYSILDESEHGSRAPSIPPRCHQEPTLTHALAQKPNSLSSLGLRLNSAHGLKMFPGS